MTANSPRDVFQLRARLARLLDRSGSGFGRNVSIMLGGTVLGQALSVLAAPVLTRLYGPAEFGYLSVYAATLMIIVVVASLRYEMAVPIARSDAEAADLFGACIAGLVATTLLITLVAFLLPAAWLTQVALGPLVHWRYLMPLGFLALGAYYVVVYVATRDGAFGDIARTRIAQGIWGPGSQIALGLCGAGAPGLALGFVLGQSSGTLVLWRRILARHGATLRNVTPARVLAAAWRYRQFPLFSSWAALLEAAGAGGAVVVLASALYSGEVAGYMFLCDRIIARPLLMVSTSILQVYVGEAGHNARHDLRKLLRRFWQLVGRQALLAGAWILIANLAAVFAMPVLFGAKWAGTAPYVHALSLGYLAFAVLHPVSHTLQLLERQALAAAWQFGRLVVVLAAGWAAWRAGWPATGALWAVSCGQLATSALMIGLIDWQIRRQMNQEEKPCATLREAS